MDRLLLAAAILAVLSPAGSLAGCGPSFKEKRTPSGDFCSDMPIIPAGQEADREYHRLQPIQSDTKARTEAERLESLRKAACNVGADAVIEAVNEEVRGDNAQYGTVSSGTAVIWIRRGTGEVKPLTIGVKKPPPPEPPPPSDAAPNPEPTATVDAGAAPPAKSAKPIGGKPPKPATNSKKPPPPAPAPAPAQ
jgi:hypothetical protein